MHSQQPKSYLSEDERRKRIEHGNMDSLYLAESRKAFQEGDEDTAWAWLARGRMPAEALLALKWQKGASFIRERKFNTELADEAYGQGWLEMDKYTESRC